MIFADVDHPRNLTPQKNELATNCSAAFGRLIRENKIVRKLEISHSQNLSTLKNTNYMVLTIILINAHYHFDMCCNGENFYVFESVPLYSFLFSKADFSRNGRMFK